VTRVYGDPGVTTICSGIHLTGELSYRRLQFFVLICASPLPNMAFMPIIALLESACYRYQKRQRGSIPTRASNFISFRINGQSLRRLVLC